ncbi:DUF3349 domain-containing protein [Mycobacterium asiaticum]|uniref:DUF3349 domain-containing protein n=1 Tax=Mycobacterium asiaticum TaxID=1790 RepID=UPI0009BF451D|nr:DUF3349 domain-containing protein [Mycobacterium asiaticum]
MSVTDAIGKILSFARAGYPKGVPTTDTFAVLAVLPQSLPNTTLGADIRGAVH